SAVIFHLKCNLHHPDLHSFPTRRSSDLENIHVPVNGVFTDKREKEILGDPEKVFKNIWAVGGKQGWYYGNWMWKVRGFLDQLVRSEEHTSELQSRENLVCRLLLEKKKHK